MELQIISPDPFGILKATKKVVANSKFVKLKTLATSQLKKLISDWLVKNPDVADEEFGLTGNFQDDLQLVFAEDAVNFCFWADSNKPKWQVEWPEGNVISSGWFALKTCFQRALTETTPISDARYLSLINREQTRALFRSSNNIEIPLLKERMGNLQEVGRILLQKFNGHFINVLDKSKGDAIGLVRLIYQNFSSFRDTRMFEEEEIFFLKRAQICASDVFYVLLRHNQKPLKNLDQLTAFSDYRLPQMLRQFGVLQYSPDLADKIDNYVLIPEGSREELEIRSATIWGVEMIRQQLKKYTAAQIDHAIWFLSQEFKSVAKPHHRTRTIFY